VHIVIASTDLVWLQVVLQSVLHGKNMEKKNISSCTYHSKKSASLGAHGDCCYGACLAPSCVAKCASLKKKICLAAYKIKKKCISWCTWWLLLWCLSGSKLCCKVCFMEKTICLAAYIIKKKCISWCTWWLLSTDCFYDLSLSPCWVAYCTYFLKK